jgi:hypothetical protein
MSDFKSLDLVHKTCLATSLLSLNLALDILSEWSGQSKDEVRKKLEEKAQEIVFSDSVSHLEELMKELDECVKR